MESTIAGPNFINGIGDMLASTSLVQFVIKKIDTILRTLEKVAKYSVQEDSKAENKKLFLQTNMERPLPWIVFWIVLIDMYIFRVVFSMILVKFDKKPIQSKDIVKSLQKWRRSLRSIRFRGLRQRREYPNTSETLNGNSISKSTPHKKAGKRRHSDASSDDTLNHDVLEELMNRTFSDTDDLDSTFVVDKSDVDSINSSSDESYQSSSKRDRETLPMATTSESEHPDPDASIKSADVTFESIVADNSDVETTIDATEKFLISPESSNAESLGNGKEALNVHSDPTDTFMSKLVNLNIGGNGNPNRFYGKSHEWKKNKNLNNGAENNVNYTSQDNLKYQKPVKTTESQESLNNEQKDQH